MAKTPEQYAWRAMIQRCTKPNHPKYKDYGARGITVCSEWLNSFKTFLSDMGPRPEGLTLERIDNNKGYSKYNCKWATQVEQNRNRRSTITVVYRGVSTTLIALCEAHPQLSELTIRRRLKRGWDLERAVSSPLTGTKIPKIIEFNGNAYSQRQLAGILGVDRKTLRDRLESGYTVYEIAERAARRVY